MSKLQKLQSDFVHDCLSDEAFRIDAAALNEDRISAEGQMSVYRESAIGNIISSLSLTYPTIENLVGQAFFRQTCRQYIHENWPGSGNMNDYGGDFAAFLEGYELARALPYLADMARLDWLFHQSSLADDMERSDWSKLGEFSPEEIIKLKIRLHPSVQLMSSPHPVLKIWEMCQQDTEEGQTLDLSKEQGAHVLIVRKDLKVELYPLSGGEMAFLTAIRDGGTLAAAFEVALALEDETTVQAYMPKHVEIGSFSQFF